MSGTFLRINPHSGPYGVIAALLCSRHFLALPNYTDQGVLVLIRDSWLDYLAQLADQIKVKQLFEIPHEVGELMCAAARQKIDDDIDKLERTIRSLKTKRNELSPISVLPSELPSKIFILTRDWSSAVQFLNHQAPWICVGQVCRHWREVALGCPSLWSIPVFTIPDLAQEMMQRSALAPLTIRLTARSWTPGVLEQLENAMAQIHRIQSIELTLGFHTEKFKTIISLLSQPAPLLRNVSLRSSTTFSDPFLFLLDALSDAPRLRSISFHHLNFS